MVLLTLQSCPDDLRALPAHRQGDSSAHWAPPAYPCSADKKLPDEYTVYVGYDKESIISIA